MFWQTRFGGFGNGIDGDSLPLRYIRRGEDIATVSQ